MSALIIGPDERAALQALRELAARSPVDMNYLLPAVQTETGMQRHMDQMAAQTIAIPLAYRVTFSIETGHPAGPCRHMSMSSVHRGRVPVPDAVWMVAVELGFSGGMSACRVWVERLDQHNVAINVVQPLTVMEESSDEISR